MDALEARLKTAQERLQAVMEQLPYSDPRAELDAAHAELLAAERALAAARGEEYAIPLEGLPPSDAGAPLPHLLADGRRAIASGIRRSRCAQAGNARAASDGESGEDSG